VVFNLAKAEDQLLSSSKTFLSNHVEGIFPSIIDLITYAKVDVYLVSTLTAKAPGLIPVNTKTEPII